MSDAATKRESGTAAGLHKIDLVIEAYLTWELTFAIIDLGIKTSPQLSVWNQFFPTGWDENKVELATKKLITATLSKILFVSLNIFQGNTFARSPNWESCRRSWKTLKPVILPTVCWETLTPWRKSSWKHWKSSLTRPDFPNFLGKGLENVKSINKYWNQLLHPIRNG